MSRKVSFHDLVTKLEQMPQKPLPLTPAGELKCEWFKKFLAQELLKNQERQNQLKKFTK